MSHSKLIIKPLTLEYGNALVSQETVLTDLNAKLREMEEEGVDVCGVQFTYRQYQRGTVGPVAYHFMVTTTDAMPKPKVESKLKVAARRLERLEQELAHHLGMLLNHPEYSGGAEAVELQGILLLQLLEYVKPRPDSQLRLKYSRFLRYKQPGVGNRTLSAITTDVEEIAKCLSEFKGTLDMSQALEAV